MMLFCWLHRGACLFTDPQPQVRVKWIEFICHSTFVHYHYLSLASNRNLASKVVTFDNFTKTNY